MKTITVALAAVLLISSMATAQWKTASSTVAVPRDLELQGIPGDRGGKSALAAVGLSLLLPGMGEWYAGNLSTGRYFMGVDGALWLAFTGFTLQASWTRSDARLLASEHAGASFAGKDDQFDVNIGNYASLADYNNAKFRSREFDLLYTGTVYQWQWDGDASRQNFKGLRIRSDQSYQNARFVVGALVVNRIVSAFSAWRSVVSSNRGITTGEYWRFRAEATAGPLNEPEVGFTLTKVF